VNDGQPDLAPLRGRAGRLCLARVRYDGFEPSEKLIPAVLLEGDPEPLAPGLAARLLECPLEDDEPPGGPPRVSDDDVADALEQLVFASSDDVLQSDEQCFDRAMTQIDRFVADRLLLLRRRHATLAAQVGVAERDLERASGAQQRTAAEERLQRLHAEVDEVETKISLLESRDDDAYQGHRERAEARRYAPPRVERLVEAELRIE
jgi:hypothetical protein